MIGIWSSSSDIYLVVVGVTMLLTFGLPLMLAPIRWAHVFRWEVPPERNLVVFLCRSLGIFITILAIFAFKAIQTPSAKPFFFELMLWIIGGMILLHVYSAIRKVQPFTETIEIIMWVALSLVTLCFYPI